MAELKTVGNPFDLSLYYSFKGIPTLNKRNAYFYSTLIVTLAVAGLFISGSPLLLIALDSKESIPLGTFITWAGMISLPMSIYWGVLELRKPSHALNKVLAQTLKLIIALGILWVPISYLLAGNLSFSFTEKATFQGGQSAMRWFWRLSYGIGVGSVLTLVMYWVCSYFTRDRSILK